MLGSQRFFLLAITTFVLGAAATVLVRPTMDSADSVALGSVDVGEAAPELDGGTAWLNTDQPVTMSSLKGKVVILDFWTFCCINCIHVMPDLAKLEKKYPNELVVIGVHSAKFDNEKETEGIRKAILRYELAHPVVNDAEHKIWDRYGVNSWPSLVLIDTEGKLSGALSGEGHYERLDQAVAKLIQKGKENKTLDEKPRNFVREKLSEPSPLKFPGKILADEAGKRLFIADSTNHRIVVVGLDGKKIAVVGSGTEGFQDGTAEEARFSDPQGMAIDGEKLFVADRKNHALRVIDLKSWKTTTLCGDGKQDYSGRRLRAPVAVNKTGLNSPWDLLKVDRYLFIAMAGHHQIWKLDLDKGLIAPYAGSGAENIRDGALLKAEFAQPSGLTTDGKFLYVADSETSSVRKLPLNGEGEVETLVGKGLFKFGDKDGSRDEARLQHALAVLSVNGKIVVADTYNSKLKSVDPKEGTCVTFLGRDADSKPYFNEPAGLASIGGTLYVADTNANRIRVVDLDKRTVTTLTLTGVPSAGKTP